LAEAYALLLDEDYRLFEDGTLVFDTVAVNLRTGATDEFKAVCPLGTGAVFHAGATEE
jgi:hypothetical protein